MELLSWLRRSKVAKLLVGGSLVGIGGGTGAIAVSQGVDVPEQVDLGEPETLDIEGDAVQAGTDATILDDGLDTPAAAALTADTPDTPDAVAETPDTPDTPEAPEAETPDNSGPSANSGPGSLSGGSDDEVGGDVEADD